MTVVVVAEEPRGIYLRAALGLLPGRRGTDLPDRELVRHGVTADPGHLAAYDRVCGFRLTGALPPTYLHVLAFPLAMRLMSEAGFPFPVVGLVHVANRITVSRPVGTTEKIDLSVRAEHLRPHDRGRQFDVVATATVAGEQVWRGVSTYLAKERSGNAKKDHPPAAPAGSAVWRVPARTGGDYAGVSGDRNPIHTSRIGARLFGFGGPIAHGMWTKARCLASLEGRLPEAYTVDVAFKLPIPLPATVSFLATPAGGGWEFRVDSTVPHLAGVVTPP